MNIIQVIFLHKVLLYQNQQKIRITYFKESIMKSNLQLDQQSQTLKLQLFKQIILILREEEDDEHEKQEDEPIHKAIIIVISLCLGLLIIGIIVCLCKCLYQRIKQKRIAQVRQFNEIQFQQQNIYLETQCLYNRELEDCPICLMPIPSFLLISTSCNHKFHKVCLALWLQVDKICPTCRMPISQ
ncbi:unnamed protein product [Paramecium sonneborni]|uniref:RING-type domain-containing protein n=1 Tax=Paramecium sonneborni TaxID=65129 RepID=A0A8S1M229_9CILI|nr:unnamed protein product [Paramecium sonneborni]